MTTCISHTLYSKQSEGCTDDSNQIFTLALFITSEVRRKEIEYLMRDLAESWYTLIAYYADTKNIDIDYVMHIGLKIHLLVFTK